MAKSEPTGRKSATSASQVLASKAASKAEKLVAASALKQMNGGRWSKEIALKAAKILENPNSSDAAKTAAASALIQWPEKTPRNAARIRSAVVKTLQKLG